MMENEDERNVDISMKPKLSLIEDVSLPEDTSTGTNNDDTSNDVPEASPVALQFLADLVPEVDFKYLMFDDKLVTYSDTGKELGEFCVTIEPTKHCNKECFLVHANSHGAIDGVPCGTSITCYVTRNLETIEQHHHEYVNLENCPLDRKTNIVRQETEYTVNRIITQGESIVRQNKVYSLEDMKGFISEGSNLLLHRLLIEKKIPEGDFQLVSFDSESILCPAIYKSLEERTQTVASTELRVYGMERTIISQHDLPTTWQSYFTADGYMATGKTALVQPVCFYGMNMDLVEDLSSHMINQCLLNVDDLSSHMINQCLLNVDDLSSHMINQCLLLVDDLSSHMINQCLLLVDDLSSHMINQCLLNVDDLSSHMINQCLLNVDDLSSHMINQCLLNVDDLSSHMINQCLLNVDDLSSHMINQCLLLVDDLSSHMINQCLLNVDDLSSHMINQCLLNVDDLSSHMINQCLLLVDNLSSHMINQCLLNVDDLSSHMINHHLTNRVQVGSPVGMKLSKVPEEIVRDVEPPKPDFPKRELDIEEDMQMYSHYLDRKEEIKGDHYVYMKHHPELKALLADFLQFLLLRKPNDVITFAAEYFSAFSTRVPNQSPYNSSNAPTPFPVSRDNTRIEQLRTPTR
ncbi:hypothetical protein LOTGIDRAFT_239113 [Lottia gigantea]|uniref:Ciliogenesis-associated TTC17-interacting protein n=1 Tax=Lottia gigantea TaxID=225164 RepID=V4AT53_LOTGI|nr:hypothetical protein LOTGIDRAFT_239113 [Lottia gigantea]ESO98070.1 hypothetical protein LOTGIDRAFT_239113 [Lottia gigantea]